LGQIEKTTTHRSESKVDFGRVEDFSQFCESQRAPRVGAQIDSNDFARKAFRHPLVETFPGVLFSDPWFLPSDA
jgi:hypothetical protein